MAKVKNATRGPITLPSLHVIPAGGELTVTNDVIRDNWSSLSGRIAIGEVAVEWDAEDAAPDHAAIPAELSPEVTHAPQTGAPVTVAVADEPGPAPAPEGRADARPRAHKG